LEKEFYEDDGEWGKVVFAASIRGGKFHFLV